MLKDLPPSEYPLPQQVRYCQQPLSTVQDYAALIQFKCFSSLHNRSKVRVPAQERKTSKKKHHLRPNKSTFKVLYVRPRPFNINIESFTPKARWTLVIS